MKTINIQRKTGRNKNEMREEIGQERRNKTNEHTIFNNNSIVKQQRVGKDSNEEYSAKRDSQEKRYKKAREHEKQEKLKETSIE